MVNIPKPHLLPPGLELIEKACSPRIGKPIISRRGLEKIGNAMSENKKIRLGIVGMGNMGKFHAAYLLNKKVARCELTAVSDAIPTNLEPFQNQVKTFGSAEVMIHSGLIDAIVIATPHYLHTSLGILALQRGLHVLVEKPISVHKADCERLLAAHTDSKQVFAAMFQLRTDPRYKKIRNLIQQGDLGEVVRFNWTITDWFRTEAYYSSGGWRATWKGEGGGVLLNQCPHNLDLLQWFCGMPAKVRGYCQLGRYHNIEVEDNVTAYWEYANGATGVFITSTGEAPGTNRLEIAGDRGRLVLEQNKLCFTRNEVSMREFGRTAKVGFAKPEVWNIELPFDSSGAQHHEIAQNFVDSILDGVPLIAPAREGVASVELANAMLYSSLLDTAISLPLDGAAYEAKLLQLVADSKFEKKVVAATGEDFTRSFSK